MMNTIVLLTLFAILRGCALNWPGGNVIWIEHGGPRRLTHINSIKCDHLPSYILNHYTNIGYDVQHHTMSALGGGHSAHIL